MGAVNPLASTLAVAAFFSASFASGQGEPKNKNKEQRAEDRFAASRADVEPIRIWVVDHESKKEALLKPEPVLTFSDPTRENSDGTVWVWGRTGRPAVIMEYYRNAKKHRVYVMHSLAVAPLTTTGDAGFEWAPSKGGVEFRNLPRASAPASEAAGRLVQMKEIMRRFAGHELGKFNGVDWARAELRALAQPIHRYADSAAGAVDGAVFTLANGTNPEIVILLEAAKGDSVPVWRYAVAKLSHAECHLSLDHEEVWTSKVVENLDPTDVYWLYYVARR
jgi:hypothetical protein